VCVCDCIQQIVYTFLTTFVLMHFIIAASVEDRYDIAVVLLRHGAKVNVEDNQGQTPLMLATYNGFVNLIELFLQKNADINVKTAV